MKNFVKCVDTKNNIDVVVFNLDKFTGKLAFALMLVGAISTYKAVKKIFTKKENETNECGTNEQNN